MIRGRNQASPSEVTDNTRAASVPGKRSENDVVLVVKIDRDNARAG